MMKSELIMLLQTRPEAEILITCEGTEHPFNWLQVLGAAELA